MADRGRGIRAAGIGEERELGHVLCGVELVGDDASEDSV